MSYFGNPPEDNLLSRTDSLLRANKNVPFVKRIMQPSKYPVRPNEGGGSSTHLMRHEIDEKTGDWHVFPMLKYDNGEYYEYPENDWQDAFKDALESGNTKRIKPRLRLTDIRARYKSFNLNRKDDRRIT
jgi:hypothetical protein